MRNVKPKKYLGQHFLNDENIARKVVDSLTLFNYSNVLEIGPGTGVLTKYLIDKNINLKLVEIDNESVSFLKSHLSIEPSIIIENDFLKIELSDIFTDKFAIIGNFPYNISTQIIFKALEHKNKIPELIGMFQKEVAERICEKKGSKKYGILSVLTQAYYDTEYLFSVSASVFTPPPKVVSAVIRLIRKNQIDINYNEKLFFKVVKLSFQQRRKTLRNSLKSFNLSDILREDAIFDLRPEQLSVKDFIYITDLIDKNIQTFEQS
ncbi:16S rRNA (adenine(1518)-N(6)/adenine(1519)-N(6))-dimethyltransferase RsmA [Flavobacteriaceae bacterium]|nr:16S rRNA (adenine(1518)-N(6)/adenine(1519)-N(6))-dimethyltransferase RsmA [Flavobacteriaceae bacterium]MDC1534931.1 16S rRNA (adenine(1518)-N(6)/adenine(1519)-N(6))-dimethyltransferase RsmA [Flavobacteriaceae bacterium]